MSFLNIRKKAGKDLPKDHESSLNVAKKAPNELGISDDAAKKIAEFAHEKINQKDYFRVGVRGGGCSGLSIYYEFCDELRADDIIFSHDNIKVCIDKKSLSLLGGSTLHYQEHLASGRFLLLNNPSAKQCSCGQSFSL
jgi:iron-sulfur cluster assembly protein